MRLSAKTERTFIRLHTEKKTKGKFVDSFDMVI